ncbi:fumarylacetoacetase [Microlunatus aurantiacus]|uniref:fumarylacetoacetase n=1 Tax=Microlunatus aurantiacus TaxID=446786 RepID=A0ABP7CPZ7_9ACTN
MSWFEVPAGAPFGTAELPYGIFSTDETPRRVGVAVGDRVLDLAAVGEAAGLDADVFRQPSLNPWMGLGPAAWAEGRGLLQSLLADESGRDVVEPHLLPLDAVTLHLPIEVADYVDFYASEHHAANVGAIFRPGGPPLTPNWKHQPIGYHGRAGTVVPTGTPVVRPNGQRKAPDEDAPTFGPSRRLDIEAELGFVVGVGSPQGTSVGVDAFADHVFGVVLLNDWSARDLQAWEYVPLGPFLGKSFATSISAWVLPLAALEPARRPLPRQDPPLLPYLQGDLYGYAIEVEVWLNGLLVSTCPYAALYYSPAQMVAHLTSNGASLRTGDLLGSGTISGPAPDQRGSLLELTWNGSRPLLLDGEERTFLADGDEVVLRGRAPAADGGILALGAVTGVIEPAPAR